MMLTTKFLPRHAPISIVSAAFGGGSSKAGAEDAPHKLISAGIDRVLARTGRQVIVPLASPGSTHHSHLQPPIDSKHRNISNPRWVSAVTKSLSDEAFTNASQGNQIPALGGDHSVAIGTLSGIIYVDAHADINVPEDSGTGSLHGMSLAWASGLARSAEPGIFDWIGDDSLIRLEKLVYIGLRDVDEAEKQTIERRGIKTFWADDIRTRAEGIEGVMRETLLWLGDETPLYVSFDIDGLDPKVAPSTGLPVPGGLSLEDGVHIMNAVRETGRLVGMDLVEVNPRVGSQADVEKTTKAGVEVVKAGLTLQTSAV